MPEPAVAEHKKLTRKDTLNFKERRMHEDIWLVQGKNLNGSHFPIACFTDSYRRRSEEKHKERCERDKQRKGRGKGVPKGPNRVYASKGSGINEDLQRQQPAVAVPNQDAQWGWTNKNGITGHLIRETGERRAPIGNQHLHHHGRRGSRPPW